MCLATYVITLRNTGSLRIETILVTDAERKICPNLAVNIVAHQLQRICQVLSFTVSKCLRRRYPIRANTVIAITGRLITGAITLQASSTAFLSLLAMPVPNVLKERFFALMPQQHSFVLLQQNMLVAASNSVATRSTFSKARSCQLV